MQRAFLAIIGLALASCAGGSSAAAVDGHRAQGVVLGGTLVLRDADGGEHDDACGRLTVSRIVRLPGARPEIDFRRAVEVLDDVEC